MMCESPHGTERNAACAVDFCGAVATRPSLCAAGASVTTCNDTVIPEQHGEPKRVTALLDERDLG